MLNRLSRITSPGREFIPQIDGLRFLAIISVIAFHVWSIATYHLGVPGDTSNPVAKTFSMGWLGVQLFFVISGFILALPFAKEKVLGEKKVKLREYFIRRLTRIEPPYIIQLAFMFLLTVLVLHRLDDQQEYYGTGGWLKYTSIHMLASLFYANDIFFHNYPYPNIVLWSLEIEVQFYILAPLLACGFAIRRKWIRCASLTLVILAWPQVLAHLVPQPLQFHLGIIGELHYFLLGFLLVEFYLAGWLAGKKNFLWDALFFLAGPALVLYINFETWILLGLCLAAFRGLIASWLMSYPLITTIGGMCYTIYMYHWVMTSALIRATIHLQTGNLWLDLLVQFIVITALIVVVCSFLFAWFERPFMRRGWPQQFKEWIFSLAYASKPKAPPACD